MKSNFLKKIALLLCFVAVVLSGVFINANVAVAAGCNQTLNTGAATTTQVFWEQPLAFYGWSGGTITNDMYFNGCGQTAAIKVNGEDWNRLLKDGKLDGLRYIKKDSNGLAMRKVNGTEIVNIPQESFFDSTTALYTGNR